MNNIPAPRPFSFTASTPKGLSFVRLGIGMALSKGDPAVGEAISANRWGTECLPARVFKEGGLDELLIRKAEVPVGATVSGNWGEVLVSLESAATEYFSLVWERLLPGRIEAIRRVPLRTRLVGLTAGFSGAWIGEGAAKPVGKATFAEEELPARKVASLAVVSRDLLQSADPAAELLIRRDMVNALAATINASFIDPSNGGTPDVEPASITNGAPSITASGDGAQDLRELIASFPGDLERAVLIGSPSSFAALSDPFLFPNLGVRGGEALGIPAVPSTAAGDTLALIDPDGIAIGEGEMGLRTSGEATIELSDAPTQSGIPPTGAAQVSLWQCNAVAILAEKAINWQAVRPAVSTVTGMAPS